VFPALDYLDWIEGRPAAATHDLGSSDLRPGPGYEGDVVPPVLADRPTPDTSVERLVAETYGVDPEQVVLAPGATVANLLAASVALGPAPCRGERVLVESPGYGPHVATPGSLGAETGRFDRPDGRLVPGRVGSLADVALVTVSDRHNPTGRRAERDALSALGERAADADARVLVDEVYAPYGPADEAPGGPFGGPSAAGDPGTVVTGSLTKFLGLGGLRVGWLIADAAFAERARAAAAHLSAVADPSRHLARRALGAREALGARARDCCVDNATRLRRFVADRDDLGGLVHEGCPVAFLRHERADGDRVAERADEQGVLVVPGRFFGQPGGFRVSAGRSPAATAAALDALGGVLDDV
jgi:aspartate/methionine/tyrosine aminotransferase